MALAVFPVAVWGQKEYVRLGGRVIAIESPAGGGSASGGGTLTVTPPGAQTIAAGNNSGPLSFSIAAANHPGNSSISCAPQWCLSSTPANGLSSWGGTLTLAVPWDANLGAQTITLTAAGVGGVTGTATFVVNVVAGSRSYALGYGTVLSTVPLTNSIGTPRIEGRIHQVPGVSVPTPLASLGDTGAGLNLWLMPGQTTGQVHVLMESLEDGTWCQTPAIATGGDAIFRFQRGGGVANATLWTRTQATVAQEGACFSPSGFGTNATNFANAMRIGAVPGSWQPGPAGLALAWLRIYDGHTSPTATRPAEVVAFGPSVRWEFDGTLTESAGGYHLSEFGTPGAYVPTPPFETPITVTPASAVLNSGMTQTFSGSAAGANPAVTWTVPGGTPVGGATYTYTAPHVTGTTTQNLRVTSVATGAFVDVPITVQPIAINWTVAMPQTVSGGQAVPMGAALFGLLAGANNQVQWLATGGSFSSGTTGPNQQVTWFAPASGTVTITARSVQNPSTALSHTVTVSAAPPPPPATLSFVEPAPGVMVGPNAIRPFIAQRSAPGAAQWSAWSINGSSSFTTSQFFGWPGWQVDYGLLVGRLAYTFESTTQSWRNFIAPGTVSPSPQTRTVRVADAGNASLFAERQIQLTNIQEPPHYYWGGMIPDPASASDFYTVTVIREDVSGNQGAMEIGFATPGGGAVVPGLHCTVQIYRMVGSINWAAAVWDIQMGWTAAVTLGQAGQVGNGTCTLDGAGSSVTMTGAAAIFKIKLATPSWANRWMGVMRPDGSQLTQYWLNY